MKKQDRSKLRKAFKCPVCQHIRRKPPGGVCMLCPGYPKLEPCWNNGELREVVRKADEGGA